MELTEQEKRWLKYRWEFMRRDPEYIQAYEEVKRLRQSAIHPPGTWEEKVSAIGVKSKTDLYMLTPEYEKEMEIGSRFSVRMIDPNLDFDTLYGGDDYKSVWARMINIHRMRSRAVTQLRFATDLDCREPNLLCIKINFSEVNSIDALKDVLIQIVGKQWDKYKANTLESTDMKKMCDYDLILRVGYLKGKGLKNREIAKELFPRDFSDSNEDANPESAIRNISHYFKKYNEMVNGGYREMKYP